MFIRHMRLSGYLIEQHRYKLFPSLQEFLLDNSAPNICFCLYYYLFIKMMMNTVLSAQEPGKSSKFSMYEHL